MSPAEVPASLPRWPIAAAILINLVPIIGVLFWGWSAFALIFLYWLENVVIGARTLVAMGANAVLGGGMNWLGAIVFGGFFSLHYGLFCFVHGTFVVALFGNENPGGSMLDLAGAAQILFAREPNLAWGMASIVAWQAAQLAVFIARGEARRTNPMALMAAPYPRIFVLHITIIAGGFLLMLLQQPLAGLVVLALIKMGFDVAEAMGKTPHLPAPNPAASESPRR